METNKLHTIKNSGFKVPENYFASLEDRILSEVKLKELVTKSGHILPDNYFDSLEDKIINSVKPKEETKVVKLFTWKKAVFTTAVAASLMLMINIYFNKTKSVTIDTIETASIENYILSEDLETSEFASLFTKEELLNIHLINDGYNLETIENYLFDNLEIEDIITK